MVSHSRVRRSSPRWAAETASTIVSELMSSTKELTEVKGMSYTVSGRGPYWVRPR